MPQKEPKQKWNENMKHIKKICTLKSDTNTQKVREKKTDLSQDPKNFTFIYVSRFLLLTAAQLNVVRVVVVVIVCGCWLCCYCRLIWLNFVGFIRLYLFFYSHSVSFWLFIRSHCDVRVVVASVFWSLLVNVCQCVLGFSIHQKKNTHALTHPQNCCVHTHTHDLL